MHKLLGCLLVLAVQSTYADCAKIYREKSMITEEFPDFKGGNKIFIVQVVSDANEKNIRNEFFRHSEAGASEEDKNQSLQREFDRVKSKSIERIRLNGSMWKIGGTGPDMVIEVPNATSLCKLIQNKRIFRIWPDRPSKPS